MKSAPASKPAGRGVGGKAGGGGGGGGGGFPLLRQQLKEKDDQIAKLLSTIEDLTSQLKAKDARIAALSKNSPSPSSRVSTTRSPSPGASGGSSNLESKLSQMENTLQKVVDQMANIESAISSGGSVAPALPPKSSKPVLRLHKLRPRPLSVDLSKGDVRKLKVTAPPSTMLSNRASSADSLSGESVHAIVESGVYSALVAKIEHDGVDCVNKKDADGRTPLHVACSTKKPSVDIIQALISRKADVAAVDFHRRTPVHEAATHDPSCRVIMLLLSSCSKNPATLPASQVRTRGNPARGRRAPVTLMGMQKKGRSGTGKSLKGVVNMGTASGGTVLHCLVGSGDIHAKESAGPAYGDMVKYVVDAGADINAVTRKGETCLHAAAAGGGGRPTLDILVRHGALVQATTAQGESVLHYAVRGENEAMVRGLLERGADPRVSRGSMPSPLHLSRRLGPSGKTVYDAIRTACSALDMSGMKKEDKAQYKQRLAQEEIVITEQHYAADLEIVLQVFYEPLLQLAEDNPNQSPLLKEEVEEIFGGFPELAALADKFSKALMKPSSDDAPWRVDIGRVFLDHMDLLGRYTDVCLKQDGILKRVDELRKRRTFARMSKGHSRSTSSAGGELQKRKTAPLAGRHGATFKQFVANARRDPRCRQLDVDDFLMKPFQRVTKYPLLLRELLALTPESDADYPDLVKAKAGLEVIIGAANQEKRDQDNMAVLQDLEKRIVWPEDDDVLEHSFGGSLCGDGRLLLKQGEMKVVWNQERLSRRCAVFLLSDAVLLASPMGKTDTYTFQAVVPLEPCVSMPIRDGSKEGGKPVKFAFSLINALNPAELTVVFQADNDRTKNEWLSAIDSCKKKDSRQLLEIARKVTSTDPEKPKQSPEKLGVSPIDPARAGSARIRQLHATDASPEGAKSARGARRDDGKVTLVDKTKSSELRDGKESGGKKSSGRSLMGGKRGRKKQVATIRPRGSKKDKSSSSSKAALRKSHDGGSSSSAMEDASEDAHAAEEDEGGHVEEDDEVEGHAEQGEGEEHSEDGPEQYCVAKHTFTEDDPDSLCINKGDRILVIKQDDESGWWYGSIGEREGFFPGAYVKLVEE